VVEKTVRKAEGAWFISVKEMRARPVSDRSFLAGETESVFEPPIGTPGMSFVTVLEMLTRISSFLYFL